MHHEKIREARSPADRLVVAELIEEYRATLPDHVRAGQSNVLGDGRDGPAPAILLLCVIGDRPAGCVCLCPVTEQVAEIKRLYTVAGYRGRGLGERLLAAAIDQARAKGFATVRLGTLRSMDAAQRLYQRAGFIPAPPFDDADPVDELHFEMALR